MVVIGKDSAMMNIDEMTGMGLDMGGMGDTMGEVFGDAVDDGRGNMSSQDFPKRP